PVSPRPPIADLQPDRRSPALHRRKRRLDNRARLAQSSIAIGERVAARSIDMARVLISNWWALAIRGVFAIIFAVIAFIWPGITATVLVLMFGAYALVDGVFALVAALRAARHHGRSGALLFEGILDLIIAGI